MFVAILDVEELDLARAVVCIDKVTDNARQVVLLGQSQPLDDVPYDYLGRLLLGELVVRVGAALVFGKEGRILYFPMS